MNKFAHIVNLASFPEQSDLHIAQPVTVETMKIARDFAGDRVEVSLLSAQFPEDRGIVPEYFIATPDLERSVLDVGDFKIRRKLPLIKDILDRAHRAAESDYIIYTNVDIALLPTFYLTVDRLIESGFDALIINRRSISTAHTRLEDLPLMLAEVGTSHLGYDCFVFRRDAFRNFNLGLVAVGAAYVGKVLFVNLMLNARNFTVFHDLHATFHIGRERAWASKVFKDYERHNQLEYNKILAALDESKARLVRKCLSRDRRRGLTNRLGDYLGGAF